MSHHDKYIEQRVALETQTPAGEPHVEAGPSLFIRREAELLLGIKRIGDQTFEYGGLGGVLERMHSYGAVALRGLVERELGPDIHIQDPRLLAVGNIRDFPPKHFVVSYFIADWESGEPTTSPASSCAAWEWHALDNLPTPLGLEARQTVEALQTHRTLFDDPPCT